MVTGISFSPYYLSKRSRRALTTLTSIRQKSRQIPRAPLPLGRHEHLPHKSIAEANNPSYRFDCAIQHSVSKGICSPVFIIPLLHMRTALLICLSFSSLALQAETTRHWTQKASGKSVQGTYQSQDDTHVKLLIKGKSFTIEKASLTQDDQTHLTSIKAKEDQPKQGVLKKHSTEKCKVPTWHSYTPPNYSPDGPKHPVCFVYSSGGHSLSVVNAFKSSADKLSWVIIGIDAYSNKRVKAESRKPILADCEIIYKEAFDQFNIDKNKVVFSGTSGGGWWSFVSSKNLNKRTAGIISQAGWMSNEYTENYPRKMAVAMIAGDKDAPAIKYEKPDGDYLKKKHRATVKTFRFSGGHMASPASSCLEAAIWVHETKEF